MVSAKEAKPWAKETMKGIIDASTLHLDRNGEVDEEAYRKWIRYMLLDLKVEGLYILGDTVEYGFCTEAEKRKLIDVAIDEMDKVNPKAIKGVSPCYGYSVRQCVENINYAKEAGADIALIMCPGFEAWGDPGILRFYRYVSERCDIAIGLYNTPASYAMSPQLVAELAKIPNICAMKNGVFNPYHTAACMRLTRGSIQITEFEPMSLISGAIQKGLASPLQLGMSTWCVETPEKPYFSKYFRAVMEGKLDEARKYFFDTGFHKVWHLFAVDTFTCPDRPGYWIHGVGQWKYMGYLLGAPVGELTVRPPNLEVTDEQKKKIRDTFLEVGLITN